MMVPALRAAALAAAVIVAAVLLQAGHAHAQTPSGTTISGRVVNGTEGASVPDNFQVILLTVDDPEEISHLMGLVESRSPHSITNSFDKLFHRQSRDYDYPSDVQDDQIPEGRDPVFDCEYESQQTPQEWNFARRELSSLLDKVKGLTRLRSH